MYTHILIIIHSLECVERKNNYQSLKLMCTLKHGEIIYKEVIKTLIINDASRI